MEFKKKRQLNEETVISLTFYASFNFLGFILSHDSVFYPCDENQELSIESIHQFTCTCGLGVFA